MIIDRKEVYELQAAGLLNVKRHPTLDCWLLDYTPKAQYSHAWDAHPLLLDCRGTIIDRRGIVLAKPFRKFFNIGERSETQIEALVGLGEPEVAHKLDGSMVTMWYSHEAKAWQFATRGSFTSVQAQAARRIWQERYAGCEKHLNDHVTHLFELIGPENRIVVSYPEDDLRLIGLVRTSTGRELMYFTVRQIADFHGLPYVETEAQPWRDLVALERANFEGFVLYWPRADRRVKVKLAEYVRLHRIVTGLSEHSVWEILATGGDTETLRSQIPEEMHAWFDRVEGDLCQRFVHLSTLVQEATWYLSGRGLMAKTRERRKNAAHVINTDYPQHLRAPLFRALDDKPYDALLWKQIEPKATPLFAQEVA